MSYEHSRPVTSEGTRSQRLDTDPEETAEWMASLDGLIASGGTDRARYVLRRLVDQAGRRQIDLPSPTTDYVNTIPPEREPAYPGDEAIERRIRAYIRWNAAMVVHRAQRPSVGVGGHISSYASAAHLYEVGFNHVFRGRNHPGGGDQVFIQGHAAPGIYARAFLEGRLSESRLDGFRQEFSRDGLPSYPHPRLMPDFWEFPTVSMGLGGLNAIYQARFNRYLHNRGIKDTSDQRVWAFLGDGEMDEPESLGAISLAARENLDNLTFIVNCNLQRLDGPVRGNGKIVQELESIFRGAGWNVIKVVWGRQWDPLLAADTTGALVNLMNTIPDGDFQTYKAESGLYVREHFFGRDPRTRQLVADMSDDELWALKRGGHDVRKLYAAFQAATERTGRPTVILAKTIKGFALGSGFEGRNATHQMKKITADGLKYFRDRLGLDIPDAALTDPSLPPYARPAEDSEEAVYLRQRRAELGGPLPSRNATVVPLNLPGPATYADLKRGSGKQRIATTMAFVRLFKDLLRDPGTGRRWVPIIPDEARTFGMDSLFPTAKIYSPHGQTYTPVDRELFLSYKEATNGQILHEGINEAGSVASFTAAGSSYATHGEPMIPLYLFYSMFGFQRTADSFWAAADQLARGFLIGATAGRTTLNGEGLQHEDGHSLLIAATNPAVVTYDPAFGFELAHIVADGLRRMYGEHAEDVFYYLTVYNEPIVHPAQPADLDVAGLLRGMYRYARGEGSGPRVRLLASGIGVQWAQRAQRMLAEEWGVVADVWSVTSWTELRRDAVACEEHNLRYPADEPRVPYVTAALSDGEAAAGPPVVAVSDFMRAVPDLIARWVPGPYTSLGTEGFGRSDTRHALRRHFNVDAESVVVAALR
ncbi:MAG: pyruvate dehydrogenase (acetyl-transferring), homodimeric type, partial [Dactylosporangium sp.]|nr:pyruvate dehydrogenase (acetyl-transferring), homodimeric type [Dactylosporangium sp.]NNJ59897.1 pyruvate dehydrogenase (acetyl-transferring), homodimeric type [Dactylosporangium sp.]